MKAIEDLADVRPTVVYCALGYSRSAAVIATWLVRSGRATSAGEAIGLMRERRPQVTFDQTHESAIEEASVAFDLEAGRSLHFRTIPGMAGRWHRLQPVVSLCSRDRL